MENRTPKLNIATLLVQPTIDTQRALTNSLAPAVEFTTNYTRNAEYGYDSDLVYGRADNPTVRRAEALLAGIESGAGAALFSSGMAASVAVIHALEKPSRIVASACMYYGLRRWLANVGQFGHSIRFIDTSDTEAFRAHIDVEGADLVWIETPSNPTWTITDISAIVQIAQRVGAIVCVDSTVATPIFTHPLQLGADIVMHSATKYLNGHSDVNAGVLVTRQFTPLWRRIVEMRAEQGGGLGAMESWLLLRGMRTLDIRVKAQARTAAGLAARLAAHPAVSQVLYPGLPTHPGHDVATRQMNGWFGAMLSIRLKRGSEAAIRAARTVRLWNRATSLGGVESLIEHRASMEGIHVSCPDDLLRLSVGLENEDDLFHDLDAALSLDPQQAPE